ncbi:hypothetical protein CSPAE12_05043 [Colletotrichum incanum]|nr:hypothetical protein CSPAE12_05043 [Colletotrichum incanum]
MRGPVSPLRVTRRHRFRSPTPMAWLPNRDLPRACGRFSWHMLSSSMPSIVARASSDLLP